MLFVLAATASVLLLADNPTAANTSKELLVGQIRNGWTTGSSCPSRRCMRCCCRRSGSGWGVACPPSAFTWSLRCRSQPRYSWWASTWYSAA